MAWRAAPAPACSRRAFLAGLGGGVAAVVASPSLGVAAAGSGPSAAADSLPETDRLVASLGRCLEREDPSLARRLRDEVEAQLADLAPATPRAERARIARRRVLDRRRVERDLARGETVLIDGWVLARSEGALAVYLCALASQDTLPT